MSKDHSTPPATDRLVFRQWHDDDLDRFQAICSDAQVMRHVGDGRVWARERTGQFIQSAAATFRQYGYCQWPLIHKVDCELIGYCGFVKVENTLEIGWRLAPEYWGQGLATEAAQAVLQHGGETLGFQEVIATVQTANVASIRVIEKLGMMLVKLFEREGRELMLYSTDATRLTR